METKYRISVMYFRRPRDGKRPARTPDFNLGRFRRFSYHNISFIIHLPPADFRLSLKSRLTVRCWNNHALKIFVATFGNMPLFFWFFLPLVSSSSSPVPSPLPMLALLASPRTMIILNWWHSLTPYKNKGRVWNRWKCYWKHFWQWSSTITARSLSLKDFLWS